MDYVWSEPERRELYLAARVLAEGQTDGDWLQWASDTLIYDLELNDDPRQGVGSWLAPDEAPLAEQLGQRVWAIIQHSPFNSAGLLTSDETSVRDVARRLVERIQANGRTLA